MISLEEESNQQYKPLSLLQKGALELEVAHHQWEMLKWVNEYKCQSSLFIYTSPGPLNRADLTCIFSI